MPFTKDFDRVRRRFRRQYDDQAKADTFAFDFARRNRIKTFQERIPKFKRQMGF